MKAEESKLWLQTRSKKVERANRRKAMRLDEEKAQVLDKHQKLDALGKQQKEFDKQRKVLAQVRFSLSQSVSLSVSLSLSLSLSLSPSLSLCVSVKLLVKRLLAVACDSWAYFDRLLVVAAARTRRRCCDC